MKYSDLCEVYVELENTSKGLEKTEIIAKFLSKIKKNKQDSEVIYLLQGRVFPDYDERELGISQQLVIKAISKATGIGDEEIVHYFKELGDLGKVAEQIFKNKRQSSLFSEKLTTKKVLWNLQKLPELEGRGTIERKLGLIVELLNSASGKEAKYIIRNVMGDLKVGVGSGLLRDAIVNYCFKPKDIEEKKEHIEKVQEAYDKSSDFAEVFSSACEGKLSKITLSSNKPIKVMLFPKAENIEDAFRIVGKPAAFEFKYDGFRVMINKNSKGEINIFTRRLDNVTNQFPDIVEFAEKYINGKDFIIDAEAIGYDIKTKKHVPFQFISQRIRRKYEIERLVKELPVELKVFDIVYYNGKDLLKESFEKRRAKLKKIIKPEKLKISLAEQIITSDESEAQEFYNKALEDNQEGLMVKSLEKPYKPGARVGYAVKLKPEDNDFDLIITGAEYGTGKRAGWLTSFDLSCQDEDGNLLRIGKASTGLKEKPEQGLSFQELTEKLEKLKTKEDGRHIEVKPEVIVTIQYQNIQKSPTYSSGYALRFPRIRALRPDRGKSDVASLQEIEKEVG